MSALNEALLLLVVGMGTVFLILTIIIYFSQLIIGLINRYAPEEEVAGRRVVVLQNDITPKMVAVITSAVSVATNGQAKIVKIEKK